MSALDIYTDKQVRTIDPGFKGWTPGKSGMGGNVVNEVVYVSCDFAGLLELGQRPRTHNKHWSGDGAVFSAWCRDGVGPATVTEYLDALQHGYPDGADLLSKYIDQLKDKLPRVTGGLRKLRHGEDGDDLDADKYLASEYETMWESRPRITGIHPRVLDVGIEWNVSGAIRGRDFYWTGMQAAVITDLLEAAGYRVRLRFLNYTWSGGYGILAQDVLIKHESEPLEIDKLALVVTPQTFRHYCLTADACSPLELGYGMGRPMHTVNANGLYLTIDMLSELFPLYYNVPEIVVPTAFNETAMLSSLKTVLAQADIYEEEELLNAKLR